MPTKPRKVPVTERALIQRINRKLVKEHELLRTARLRPDGNQETDLGRFFVVDTFHNRVARTNVDIEEQGRELGVLQPWEVLAEAN